MYIFYTVKLVYFLWPPYIKSFVNNCPDFGTGWLFSAVLVWFWVR